MDCEQIISDYIKKLSGSISQLPVKTLVKVVKTLNGARVIGASVYTFGNGGSASTASHFASDLNKGAIRDGMSRFRAVCFNDNIPLLTAWANDVGYKKVFSKQVENFVRKGDAVIAISGSGNSENVLNAVGLAKKKGAFVIGLTGFDGGRLKDLADIAVVVPSDVMEQVEDAHLAIEHIITTCLRSGD